MTQRLKTARLILVEITHDLLRAQLEGADILSGLLEARLPTSWPPPLYDNDTVRYILQAADVSAGPDETDWPGFFMLMEAPDASGHFAVGICSFKGGPDAEGAVEIGYSVVPEFQRRGFATEACLALIALAFARPQVRRIVAHTLDGLTPSIRVLEKLGFVYDGPGAEHEAPESGEQVVRYVLGRT